MLGEQAAFHIVALFVGLAEREALLREYAHLGQRVKEGGFLHRGHHKAQRVIFLRHALEFLVAVDIFQLGERVFAHKVLQHRLQLFDQHTRRGGIDLDPTGAGLARKEEGLRRLRHLHGGLAAREHEPRVRPDRIQVVDDILDAHGAAHAGDHAVNGQKRHRRIVQVDELTHRIAQRASLLFLGRESLLGLFPDGLGRREGMVAVAHTEAHAVPGL